MRSGIEQAGGPCPNDGLPWASYPVVGHSYVDATAGRTEGLGRQRRGRRSGKLGASKRTAHETGRNPSSQPEKSVQLWDSEARTGGPAQAGLTASGIQPATPPGL